MVLKNHTGRIRCNKFAVAEGCFFQGEIKMPGEESQPVASVERGQSAKDKGEPETGD